MTSKATLQLMKWSKRNKALMLVLMQAKGRYRWSMA
jgi:hypothetical protein